MVTTLSPCWYCSGLIRQFQIGAVVIGESRNFIGRPRLAGRPRRRGPRSRRSPICVDLLACFIEAQPDLWDEDIGR